MKHLAYVVAGISALACTILPVSVSVWLECHQWVVPTLGVVCFAAIVTQAILQWIEDKERKKRDKQRDENHKQVVELLERVGGASPQRSIGPIEATTLTAEDPRIYVEVTEDGPESSWPNTTFVLRNLGGDVAHGVKIEPLKLISGMASFEAVDHIAAHEQAILLPGLSTPPQGVFGIAQRHDIRQIMLKDWDSEGRGSGTVPPEFSRRMRILYKTFSRTEIETTFDLVFLPIKYIARRNYNERPRDQKNPETLQIRNLEIKPIPR